MIRFALALVAITVVLAAADIARAAPELVVASCPGSAVYVAGTYGDPTVNTTGTQCTSADATGTFTTDSDGATGGAVPGSASYNGVNIAGDIVGQTGYSAASGEKAAAVVDAGNSYKHIATSTTTLVKSGAGTLHTICINTLGTVASTIEFDDATTHTTPVIGILNSLTTGQGCYTYDVSFGTGLSVTTTGAPDVTLSYR